MKFEWEYILDELKDITTRAKVHGGWIVKHTETIYGAVFMNMVFVPDPDHKWEIS